MINLFPKWVKEKAQCGVNERGIQNISAVAACSMCWIGSTSPRKPNTGSGKITASTVGNICTISFLKRDKKKALKSFLQAIWFSSKSFEEKNLPIYLAAFLTVPGHTPDPVERISQGQGNIGAEPLTACLMLAYRNVGRGGGLRHVALVYNWWVY